MERIELDETTLQQVGKAGALKALVRLKTRVTSANEERDILLRLTEQLDEKRQIFAHLRSEGAKVSMKSDITHLTNKVEALTDTLAARDKLVEEARVELETNLGLDVEVEGGLVYVVSGNDPRVTEGK